MRMAPAALFNMLGGVVLAGFVVACQPQGIDEGPEIAPDPSAYQELMLRSDADPSAIATNARTCADIGGTWRRDGMLGAHHCFQTYSDGGKSCTDGNQCEGDCRVTPDDASAGQCVPDSSPFGCYARMEDGKSRLFLCVD